MTTFLLVVTVLVALALIGIILIQRSEGGGLGIGSGQGVGAFMTGRGTATLLTRGTGVLAALFMILCLTLDVLNRGASTGATGHDILSQPPAAAQDTASSHKANAPSAPAQHKP